MDRLLHCWYVQDVHKWAHNLHKCLPYEEHLCREWPESIELLATAFAILDAVMIEQETRVGYRGTNIRRQGTWLLKLGVCVQVAKLIKRFANHPDLGMISIDNIKGSQF